MKEIFKISILLNVVLLGSLAVPYQSKVQSPQSIVQAPALRPISVPAPVVKMVVAPFRWNQLVDTNDYRNFVTNLRAVGCPETTVENVVRGDTEQVYSLMRERLGISATEDSRWSAQAQMQMTAYLLGQSPATVSAQNTVADDHVVQPPMGQQTEANTLVAFLQNADLTSPGMTAEQAQETSDLRATYLTQMSGSHAVGNRPDQSSTSDPDNITPNQSEADNSQTLQVQKNTARMQRTPAEQALIEASQQQSILAGLFGGGAAMQYEQYQTTQPGQ
ncbi:MAG TPA: hypothetical protein VGN23_14540 [Verrucomicrobiae bacterium]